MLYHIQNIYDDSLYVVSAPSFAKAVQLLIKSHSDIVKDMPSWSNKSNFQLLDKGTQVIGLGYVQWHDGVEFMSWL